MACEVIFDAQIIGAKVRPCVVLAGSPSHLIVRPCYSEGGVRARDWRSVPLGDWCVAGLDRPTCVAMDEVCVLREQVGRTIGRLSDADWNQL